MIALLLIIAIVLIIIFRPKYRHPEKIRHALTNEECDYIKERATPLLKKSTLADDKHVDMEVRDSETAWLDQEDPRIHEIIHRFVDDCDTCENLQVVRYKQGGFYIPHQDADSEHTNKRKHTFIFALNDEYEGGATSFPVLGKSYRMYKGDALSFDTLDSWGRIPEKAIHAGEPVESGEKWICNLWVRQSSYA
jgi:hypothetical protein